MYGGDAFPFTELAENVISAKDPSQLKEKDSLLVLWGGADINPDIYRHPKSRTTHNYPYRDDIEVALANKAIELGIPIIGVCRGAQLLCALAGGFLIQDVTNHAGSHHTVDTYDGARFRVNSIHHQMLAGLENVEHDMLAWSTEKRSSHYTYKDDQVYVPSNTFVEPEAVWFPTIKGLAIQWHPEAMDENSEATKFVLREYHERTNQQATV